MLRSSLLSCLFILLLAAPVSAFAEQPQASLVGDWTSTSVEGVFTQLQVEASGKFVFRQQHSNDLRRSYMCGSLSDAGSTLDLQVQAQKTRTQSGHIEQAMGSASDAITVLSRSDNRMVVTIDAKTVVLEKLASI